MPAVGNRQSTAAGFALELGGASAGWARSFEGGDAYADVVSERSGTDNGVRKSLGAVHYADVGLGCGPETGATLFQWLAETLQQKVTRRDGAVATVGVDGKQQARLEFSQALVSSIAFPALDAASKDAVRLTVALSPESTCSKPGGGAVARSKAATKKWLASSFRLTLDGIDCTHVSKIAPLVVRQKLIDHATGGSRDVERQPAGLEIPDLVVTVAEGAAQTWRDWHESFVVQGENGAGAEKSGQLELLAADLKTVLFTLRFHGLGIYRLASEKVEAGSENVRRLTASMYCEGLELFLGAAPKPVPARQPSVRERPAVAAETAGTVRVVR
jgi:hypothetical protein